MLVALFAALQFSAVFALAANLVISSKDGTHIYTQTSGNPANPALVLVSGLGLSAASYDDIVKDSRMLDNIFVVRYDVRGHGRSGKPTSAGAYLSQRFAEDFDAVRQHYNLNKPVFAGWSYGATIPTDIASFFPPNTIGGHVSIAGVPATGDILSQMASPALVAALPGLIQTTDVALYQNASTTFTDRLFSNASATPYSVKAFFNGQGIPPVVMNLNLNRQMNLTKLWVAGQQGLPLLLLQGDHDLHRAGGIPADQVYRPHFKTYKFVPLPGSGHAISYERPKELIDGLVEWTVKYAGKNYH